MRTPDCSSSSRLATCRHVSPESLETARCMNVRHLVHGAALRWLLNAISSHPLGCSTTAWILVLGLGTCVGIGVTHVRPRSYDNVRNAQFVTVRSSITSLVFPTLVLCGLRRVAAYAGSLSSIGTSTTVGSIRLLRGSLSSPWASHDRPRSLETSTPALVSIPSGAVPLILQVPLVLGISRQNGSTHSPVVSTASLFAITLGIPSSASSKMVRGMLHRPLRWSKLMAMMSPPGDHRGVSPNSRHLRDSV
mmetsp:Transcript_51591/g.164981  ORF Transcript_51591/g.164981 Transcript_51591/m.164981 type:complete len:249 (-) Transcript_51591:506-1252(-)